MVRVELELYQAGKHERKIIELVPQDDGTQAIAFPTEFGPLSIVLGEPIAIVEPAAAEPEPIAPEPATEPAPAPELAAVKAATKR